MKSKVRTALQVAISLAVVGGLSIGTWAEDKEEGFKRLGNGKDMSDFTLVGTTAETWKVDGDVIKCTGKPNGYFATKKSYKNFVFRLDYRYERPAGLEDESKFNGNSGYLVYIENTKHEGAWPKCIEVQGMNRNVGQILFVSGYPKSNAKDFPEARKMALKPVGEWNSIEIISKDGAITALLNGTKVAECEAGEIKEGPIGFQSEGAEIHFRKLRIKEM